ncbi:MAG: hypothetical protein HQ572_03725 [Candidatus Omnitrophica bacterium]|nr:hypothetical protein [Candidatus Omnitrophota bacterium]
MFNNIKEALLIIFIVVTVAAAGGVFMLKRTAEAMRIATEDRLFQETISKKKIDETLLRESKERDGLKATVDKTAEDVKALESEVAKAKREKDSAKQKISSINSKVAKTNSKIQQASVSMEELKKRIANMVKDTLNLNEELELAQEAANALKDRLKDYVTEGAPAQEVTKAMIQEEYYDEPPTRTNLDYLAKEPDLAGEILTINREFDFIVVSLGARDGMREGMEMDIYRDNKILGQAEVETVRENISAAAIIDQGTLADMRPGDRVYIQEKA